MDWCDRGLTNWAQFLWICK